MWKGFFSIQKNVEECSHPKTVTLSTITIVSWVFFLFSQLVKTERTSLGLVCVVSLLVLSFLVEPHLNVLVPFRRLRTFDESPPLLIIFSSILISLISVVYLVVTFFFVKDGELIVIDSSWLSVVLRAITSLFVVGVTFRFVWPSLRNMDLTIEVGRAEGHTESSNVQ